MSQSNKPNRTELSKQSIGSPCGSRETFGCQPPQNVRLYHTTHRGPLDDSGGDAQPAMALETRRRSGGELETYGRRKEDGKDHPEVPRDWRARHRKLQSEKEKRREARGQFVRRCIHTGTSQRAEIASGEKTNLNHKKKNGKRLKSSPTLSEQSTPSSPPQNPNNQTPSSSSVS